MTVKKDATRQQMVKEVDRVTAQIKVCRDETKKAVDAARVSESTTKEVIKINKDLSATNDQLVKANVKLDKTAKSEIMKNQRKDDTIKRWRVSSTKSRKENAKLVACSEKLIEKLAHCNHSNTKKRNRINELDFKCTMSNNEIVMYKAELKEASSTLIAFKHKVLILSMRSSFWDRLWMVFVPKSLTLWVKQ